MEMNEVVEYLSNLSIIDCISLTKELEIKWGVSSTQVQQVQQVLPEEVVEKTEFDVILTDSGPTRINVIKVVREALGLGLKESKDLVDTCPKVLKESISKEEALALSEKIKAAGGLTEIK
jgi:large subunit ribosomal protein L7/L12